MPPEPLLPVAAGGDYLATLEALRDRVAAQIDATDSARDVAALSQRLLDVPAAIEDATRRQPQQKGTALDEFTQRRLGPSASPGAKGAAKRTK